MQPLLLAITPFIWTAATQDGWAERQQAHTCLPRPRQLRGRFGSWRCRSCSTEVAHWQHGSPTPGSGISSRRPRSYWKNDDNIRMELEPHVTSVQHTPEETPTRYLPTTKALREAGLTALATAIDARGGMDTMTTLMAAKVKLRQYSKMSEEARGRMSEVRKGKKLSPEVRAKIAASRQGVQHSAATKQKIQTSQIAIAKAKAAATGEPQAGKRFYKACDTLSRRPRSYWENDVNMRMELEPHVTSVQHTLDNTPTRYLPTRKTLLQAGLTALATAVGTRGGLYSAAIMKLMNAKVIPRHQRHYEKPGVREGGVVTEQARHRMSEARKGKTHSAEVCAKIAASRGGQHHSEATKQKIGASRSAAAKKKAALAAEPTAEAARVPAEAAGGESGAEKTTGTKRNRRVRRSKSSAAVNDPDQEASRPGRKSKATSQARVEPSQRRSKSLAGQESLQHKGKSKAGAEEEPAQDLSKGKTRTGRAVGEAEMQDTVAELTQLKRDLKKWRSGTESTYGRSFSEEEAAERFPHVHKKMRRHAELQDFMRSLS